MQKIQVQGLHHVTLAGAGRQISIDFWEGLLGMPLIFDQPNLDNPAEGHLYFDPGDGRLVTVFTDESRTPDPARKKPLAGDVHHLAFAVSRVSFTQAADRLAERGIWNTGVRDRGFMDSIYFHDPMGLLIELATWKFEPPAGCTHAEVLHQAHLIRAARGDRAIAEVHIADAIEALVARRKPSLSPDRGPGEPYGR